MLDGGTKDSQLVDNREAAGIVYCCGRHHSLDTAIIFFVPLDLDIQPGDIVQIRDGGEANGSRF
jgi:hypothetical protein